MPRYLFTSENFTNDTPEKIAFFEAPTEKDAHAYARNMFDVKGRSDMNAGYITETKKDKTISITSINPIAILKDSVVTRYQEKLSEQQKQIAHQILARYDFGELDVIDTGTFQHGKGEVFSTMRLEGDNDTRMNVSFNIQFAGESCILKGVSALDISTGCEVGLMSQEDTKAINNYNKKIAKTNDMTMST